MKDAKTRYKSNTTDVYMRQHWNFPTVQSNIKLVKISTHFSVLTSSIFIDRDYY